MKARYSVVFEVDSDPEQITEVMEIITALFKRQLNRMGVTHAKPLLEILDKKEVQNENPSNCKTDSR